MKRLLPLSLVLIFLTCLGCILRWQLPPATPLRYEFRVAWEQQLEHPVTLKPVAVEDLRRVVARVLGHQR